ncbi:MAG: replicative DNA helicase [Armatimonadetes bacterium]|nr:replicative DNA helicase [Armatimonadota bacterium]
MLLEPGAAARAFAIVGPEDFYWDDHQVVCRAMVACGTRNEPVDLVTVSAELRRNGQLDKVGGGTYLTALISQVPTAAHVVRYANIVAEKAVLRRLIEAGGKIQGMGFDNPEDVGEVLDRAEQAIFEIAERRLSGDFEEIGNLITETVEKLDKTLHQKGALSGVATGIHGLNRITSGLQPGDLVIVAGRPSMGKTSFAINSIGMHTALIQETTVAIFSLEMTKMQLAEMMLCAQARVNSWRLRTGQASPDDWTRISHALGALPQAPIFIDDTPSISILELRSKCRRLQAKVPLGLIIIDYLQLCTAPGFQSDSSRHQEIGYIARSLKALARELQVPVVALSQLSRRVEQREDKRPILSDLAESGSIEAEADLVCFLFRPAYYERRKKLEESQKRGEAPPPQAHEEQRPDVAEIIIAKHRNGPVGSIDAMFDPGFRTFHDTDTRSFE